MTATEDGGRDPRISALTQTRDEVSALLNSSLEDLNALEARRADLDKQLNEVVAEADRTRKQTDSYREELHGLTAALRRLGADDTGLVFDSDGRVVPWEMEELAPKASPSEQAQLGEEPWPQRNRSEAVLDVLRASEEPIAPADIAEVLRSHGRDDDPRAVSAALAYLKRQDPPKAERKGHGKWMVAGADAPVEKETLDV